MLSNGHWVLLAKRDAAGTARDDEVCSFSLKLAVHECSLPTRCGGQSQFVQSSAESSVTCAAIFLKPLLQLKIKRCSS